MSDEQPARHRAIDDPVKLREAARILKGALARKAAADAEAAMRAANSADALSVGDGCRVKVPGLERSLFGTVTDVWPNGELTVAVDGGHRGSATLRCPGSWCRRWPPPVPTE